MDRPQAPFLERGSPIEIADSEVNSEIEANLGRPSNPAETLLQRPRVERLEARGHDRFFQGFTPIHSSACPTPDRVGDAAFKREQYGAYNSQRKILKSPKSKKGKGRTKRDDLEEPDEAMDNPFTQGLVEKLRWDMLAEGESLFDPKVAATIFNNPQILARYLYEETKFVTVYSGLSFGHMDVNTSKGFCFLASNIADFLQPK